MCRPCERVSSPLGDMTSTSKCTTSDHNQILLRIKQARKERKGRMGVGVGVHHLSAFRIRSSAPTIRCQEGKSVGQPELIRSGIVCPVLPKDAAQAMSGEGFRLLDIRPAWEWEKARVAGSLHVPLFVADTGMGPITLVKKWVHFGYIGLWTGQNLTTINDRFLPEVEEMVPDKEEKLLVACGEGLRSMIAVRVLHENGYKNLGWLAGGFNRSTDGDFLNVEGNSKLQYATIGGASYILLQLLLFLQVIGKKD